MSIFQRFSEFEKKGISDIPTSENESPPASPLDAGDVARTLELGASSAPVETRDEGQPKPPTPGLTTADPPKKRRGRPPKNAAPPPPQEPPNPLGLLFTPDYIGRVWVTMLNSAFNFCDAPPLNEQEEGLHKLAFTEWVKHRFPVTGPMQPDAFLGAVLLMSAGPRIQPIAKKTAPFWKRASDAVREWWKKRRRGD